MNRTFDTGAQRDQDTNKPQMSLMPHDELIRVMNHYKSGAKKYGANNWKNGMPLSVYYDSAQRHLLKWWQGDTTEDHAAAAVWNIMCAMWTEKNKQDTMDDRHK